jgi:hypothetical protein
MVFHYSEKSSIQFAISHSIVIISITAIKIVGITQFKKNNLKYIKFQYKLLTRFSEGGGTR